MPTMSVADLEKRLIYCIIVAGKSAKLADKVCERLWAITGERPPFEWVRGVAGGQAGVEQALRQCGSGAYQKNARAIFEVANATDLDLEKCSPSDLERFYGIGMKTSRFFVTWTRPEERYAVLDVHILRWMRQRGVWTPNRTPRYPRQYERLEEIFIFHADCLGLTPRQLDWKIWRESSNYQGDVQDGPVLREEV